MVSKESIKQSLTPYLLNLADAVTFVDDSADIDLKNIKEGVLIIHAGWSGHSISSTTATIHFLDELKYSGHILVVNIDCISTDFQTELLGNICHGWGEIFVIKDGVIIKRYWGKQCFQNFKEDKR